MSEVITPSHHEAIIIGGGQAGLATAYYLQKQGVDFKILDNQMGPGGAWQQYWPTLTLFSTASFSHLPGIQMPTYGNDDYPPASHVVDYFTHYEQRYQFPLERPVQVDSVTWDNGLYTITAGERSWTARQVVAATGIWAAPHTPSYPGDLTGTFWHAANYPGPETFRGAKVAVVGAGNSGAQIAAELSEIAEVTWYTREEPHWMPDDISGRDLFRNARDRALTVQRGEPDPGTGDLGHIIMVPEVLAARDAGRLTATPMFDSVDEVDANHLIWCTGFDPALGPLAEVLNGRQPKHPGLHLVGYGDWTGPGSATILGVGPYAKATAKQIAESDNLSPTHR